MLVRIQREDVEIGMFVHAFEGSWFDHPFWRRYFRIETEEQLALLAEEGCTLFQGFLCAPPVDTAALEKMVAG